MARNTQLTIAQAAKAAKVSPQTIRSWGSRGELKMEKVEDSRVPAGFRFLVDKNEVVERAKQIDRKMQKTARKKAGRKPATKKTPTRRNGTKKAATKPATKRSDSGDYSSFLEKISEATEKAKKFDRAQKVVRQINLLMQELNSIVNS